MSMKRQRDSRDEGNQNRKKPHLELRERHQEPLTFAKALVSGASLNEGHITGKLKEITPNGSEMSLTLRDDDSDKTLCCIFSEFTNKVHDFNSRIGKRVKVALTNPQRVPTAGINSKKYPYDLRFHPYCFIIDGEMFEDTKNKEKPSFIGGSDSEEEDRRTAHPPVTNNRAVLPQANQSVTTSAAVSREQKIVSGSNSLPDSLISIKAARMSNVGTLVNIAGVVHGIREARELSTGQWGIEVKLKDQSCTSNEFLEVKLYAIKREYLPDLTYSNADGNTAIILSKIKIQERHGFSEGIGYKEKFRYCCFSKKANKLFSHSMDNQDLDTFQQAPVHACTEEETRALRRLVNGEMVRGEITDMNPRRHELAVEEKRIEEIKLNDTFSCTVELLHVFLNTSNGSADIAVTDYTSNPLLDDPDTTRYRFPPGNRTLRITLFDNPAHQARVLEVGKIYRLPRVRFTESKGYRQGRCGNGQEGMVTKILAPSPQDDLVKNLLARKRAYGSGPISRSSTYTAPVTSRQTAPIKKKTPPTEHDEGPAQVSASTSTPTKPIRPQSPPPAPGKVYPAFPEYTGEIEAYNSIECAAPGSHPLKTLKEIDDSPECPAIFCSKARIVDVEPHDLAAAIVSLCEECGAMCKVGDTSCPSCKRSGTLQNRVRVDIIFQDASGELCAKVRDETAERFFRLSKSALQRGNEDKLLQDLSNRFQILMGRRPGLSKYEVGGVSEVMRLVVKSWHVKDLRGRWMRYHKLSGCRVNLGST